MIIAVLASILLPALATVRKLADRLVCAGNLKQCGLVNAMYNSDNNDYFAWYRNKEPNLPHQEFLWDYYFSPYLIGKQIEWNKTKNMSKILRCPSVRPTIENKNIFGINRMIFSYNAALGGMNDGERPVPFERSPKRMIHLKKPSLSFLMADTGYGVPAGSLQKNAGGGAINAPYHTDPTNASCSIGYNRHNLFANFLFTDGHVIRIKNPLEGSLPRSVVAYSKLNAWYYYE